MSDSALYLLDTNTASYLLNSRSATARQRWSSVQRDSRVAISTITEAELRFGLANKPGAFRLQAAVETFLAGVEILPWDSAAAQSYGPLRHQLTTAGKTLAQLDLLIAAHALSLEAILVSSDRAFQHTQRLVQVVDWATDLNTAP